MTKFHFPFLLLLLPLFYLVRKDVTFHAVIPHRNHTEIFIYLSNVAKFQELNPTIIGITRWERINETDFRVDYTEYLSQVPAVNNYARASYRIQHGVDGSHGLHSQHLTCFFADFLCLSTTSALRIAKLSKSKVGYSEQISYTCPWALSDFCFREISFQRRLITTKLQEIFSTTGKQQNDILPRTQGHNKGPQCLCWDRGMGGSNLDSSSAAVSHHEPLAGGIPVYSIATDLYCTIPQTATDPFQTAFAGKRQEAVYDHLAKKTWDHNHRTDLTVQDKEEWAHHLGHSVEIHDKYYRNKEVALGILKTGRILKALDEGTIKFYKGKEIDEIPLTDSSMVGSSTGDTS